MKNLVTLNWLILAVASLLVGIYISLFESFLLDKGYLYFMMALLFGFIFYRKRYKTTASKQ